MTSPLTAISGSLSFSAKILIPVTEACPAASAVTMTSPSTVTAAEAFSAAREIPSASAKFTPLLTAAASTITPFPTDISATPEWLFSLYALMNIPFALAVACSSPFAETETLT